MTVRLSCDDYAWPALSHATVLRVIADLGFAGVDIGVFADATHVTAASVVEDPKQRAKTVTTETEAADLVVADVFLTSDLDLARVTPTSRYGDDQDELRRIFGAVAQFAVAVGAKGITMLPGVVADGQSMSEAIGLAAEGLRPLVDLGQSAGLDVSVEPHVGSCIESPAATADLLDRCDGLTVTLDPAHFVYQGWDVPSMLGLLPRTRHVQIRPGAEGVMQAKVSDNGFDLALLVSSLLAGGYDGWIASEFVWMAKWGCDEVDNTGESQRLRVLLEELVAASVGING